MEMLEVELIPCRKRQNTAKDRVHEKRKKALGLPPSEEYEAVPENSVAEKEKKRKLKNAERCRKYREKSKGLKSGAGSNQGMSNNCTITSRSLAGDAEEAQNSPNLNQDFSPAGCYKDVEGITLLDEFKRCLVRDIARRRYQGKQSEDEMFQQLDTKYGCECKLLWDLMTSLTLKKLKRTLVIDDRTDNINKILQMTSTDWFTFDQVLVHEKVDVIGEDLARTANAMPYVHWLLFYLVQKHKIEDKAEQNVDPKILVNAWSTLTQEYNTGGRKSSPMLLQRRWYQLKETTGSKVYDVWMKYKENPRLFEKALSGIPSKLQINIAKTYGESDCLVIEPNVQTIEVGAESDNEEDNKDETANSDSALVKKEYTIYDSIDIEESELLPGTADVDIPLDNEISNLTQDEEEHEMYPPENGISLPKIISVMGHVLSPECNTVKNVPVDVNIQEITKESIETPCDDGDDEQIITDQIKKESNPIDYDPVVNESIPIDCDLVGKDSIPRDRNIEKTIEVGNNVSKIHNKDGIIPELPVDLQSVDDCIESTDDADYEQDITPCTIKKEKDCGNTKENDTGCRIDPKLIMYPISYTKKLDDMDVFKNSSFLTVKGNDIIQRALVESKPVFEKAAEEEEFSEEHCNDASKPIPRFKFTNWRLQKPKNRSYNPIQLCKNPDFNTRLKKLTVDFFSSKRNRLLLSACKPLTIDLHKGFEDSLVDNTLYLERTNSPIIKQEKDIEVCKNTASVFPSPMAMQSLLDNRTKEKNVEQRTPEQHVPKQKIIEEQITTNSTVVETKKIVKLPNIEQIRHQNLLVAEVSPMPSQYNTQNSTPPLQLVGPAKSTSHQTVSIKSEATSSESNPVGGNESRPVNIVFNNQNIFLVKRKADSIPKLKPTNTLPARSQPPTNGPEYDGSLIPIDTLHKMLSLLSGTEVPSKYEHSIPEKGQKGNEKELADKKNNKAIPKKSTSTAKVDAVVENGKMDVTKDE